MVNVPDCNATFDLDIMPHECAKGAGHITPHVCGTCGVRWQDDRIVGYQDENVMDYEEFNEWAEEMAIDLMMRDAGWRPTSDGPEIIS